MKDNQNNHQGVEAQIFKLQARIRELEKAEKAHLQLKACLETVANEWRTTFDAVSDSIMLLDNDHRIIRANLATAKFLKKPIKEIIGMTCHELCHEAAEPPDTCVLKKMAISKEHEESIYKEGNRWILVSVDPLLDSSGQVTGCVHVIKDITESQIAAEDLKRLIRQNELVLKTMMDGYILADTEGKLVDVNPAYSKMVGYTHSELMKMSIRDLEIRIPVEQIQQRIERMVEKGFDQFETIHRSKDGRSIYLDVSIVIMKPDGKPLVSAFVRDITKQKETEKALKESQANLSLIFNNVSDSISLAKIEKDGKQRLINVNDAFKHEFGYTDDTIIGKMIDSLATGEDYTLGKQMCTEAIRTKKIVRFVREFDTPRGKTILDYDTIPIFDEGGECTHFLYVTRNITERVRAEEALQKSEERYSSVVEKSKDGIVIHESGIIKFVNSAAMELTGYSQDEFIGSNIMEHVTPEYLDLAMQRFTDRSTGKDVPNIYEIAIKRKDGSEMPVELNVSLMNNEGRPASLVYLRDLTERKKAEAKIKKSLEEKEVLLREIHHRVKNNMQIISSLLRLQSQSIEDKAAQEKFTISQDRIKSMALIHEGLYRSKDLSIVDFSDYIRNLTQHLSKIFGPDAKHIDIKLDLEQIDLQIDAAIPLGLIINELVSNSLKHAFPGGVSGEILIRMRKEKQGGFTLLVKDSGIGFPEELDFRTTETLGMNIVSDLVLQLDGTIDLNREDGAEFRISF